MLSEKTEREVHSESVISFDFVKSLFACSNFMAFIGVLLPSPALPRCGCGLVLHLSLSNYPAISSCYRWLFPQVIHHSISICSTTKIQACSSTASFLQPSASFLIAQIGSGQSHLA